MGKSNITYLDWNITCVEGCTPISAGCQNCYAQEYLTRFKKPTGIVLHPDRLEKDMKKLARIKERQVVGIAFTGDLFHDDVPGHFIHSVWQAAFNMPQHTYLFLTKRPKRLLDWTEMAASEKGWPVEEMWPDWMWLGVSVEDQKTADERIPILLSISAAHHWLSIEPMLEPVELPARLLYEAHSMRRMIDWIVCGGETGPGARPMHPDWARKVRDDCEAAGVPFMFKQWGEWFPHPYGDWEEDHKRNVEGVSMWRHRRLAKVSGEDEHRLLDGVVHDGRPGQ